MHEFRVSYCILKIQFRILYLAKCIIINYTVLYNYYFSIYVHTIGFSHFIYLLLTELKKQRQAEDIWGRSLVGFFGFISAAALLFSAG